MVLKRSVGALLKLVAESLKADEVALLPGGGMQPGFATSLLVPILPPGVHLFLGWRVPRPTPDVTNIAPIIEGLKLILAKDSQEAALKSLLAQVTRLQWELADSKIAEKTAGLIASGEAEPARIHDHIARVLQSVEGIDTLSKRIEHLEAEITARKQITAAKAILQRTRGLSEQQSYLHLQRMSRQTRRALVEVADEIVFSMQGG